MTQAFPHRLQRAGAAFGGLLLLGGCGLSDAPIISPKGPIALAERDLLFTATAVMLFVIIPVIVMAFLFAWHYRASNTKARYTPNWSLSLPLEATVWLIPAMIVIALGHLVWTATHKLDPYKPLDSAVAPLEVQVVAQDWKWLFIYPEQQIASVNELVFPSGRPLSLKITSDTAMNSFFIPALGGQIYAMAGMQAKLHLLADQPGQFTGRNTQYSGDGFSDQHFQAIAAAKPDFESWIAKVRQSPGKLDADAYRALATPSIAHPVTYYSSVAPNLFETILAKYRGHKAHDHQRAAEAANRKF